MTAIPSSAVGPALLLRRRRLPADKATMPRLNAGDSGRPNKAPLPQGSGGSRTMARISSAARREFRFMRGKVRDRRSVYGARGTRAIMH